MCARPRLLPLTARVLFSSVHAHGCILPFPQTARDSPAFVMSRLVHAPLRPAEKQGVRFVRPAVFPTLPLPSLETRGGRGGHSIGTPRHSEGNHAKYFPLSVVRASHTHTHTQNTVLIHTLGDSVAHSNTRARAARASS